MWTTNPQLLSKVKAGDEISWQEFYQQYKPFAYRIGQRHNLSVEECEDLVQRSMSAMFERCQTFVYDPGKGKFRGYLAHLVRNQLVNILREKKKNAAVVFVEEVPEDVAQESFEEEFDQEYQQFELDSALDELKATVSPRTYEAFHLSVMEVRSGAEVAQALGMTESAVYVYKKRCQDKLKRILESMHRGEEKQ